MKKSMISLSATLGCLAFLAQAQEEVSEDRLPPVLRAADDRGNKDGKIQREELPERLQRVFERYDLNSDGVITPQEVDEGKAKAFAEQPKLENVIGDLPPGTLDLLGGKLYEVGWSEGRLFDAARKRDVGFLIRYPKAREGLTPIVLLSHGGHGNSFGQYGLRDLATSYARLGFLAVNIGHSFGAFTAQAVGGANLSPTTGIRNFRDPRVDAIVPISPQGFHRFGSYDEGLSNNSWSDIRIPVYLICGEQEGPEWRRQPFDRYPACGDKFFTIGKGYGHNIINGDQKARRLLALNTALFFHTYLRGGTGRDKVGTLAWIEGWTLARKIEARTARSVSAKLHEAGLIESLRNAKTIDIKSLKTIWMPKEDAAPEQAAAKVLQDGFHSLYGFRPTVLTSPPAGGTPGILLGRQSALACGEVTEAELEAVKPDGYVIKAVGNRIILAGYDRVGTRYAPAALLRRLGMRFFPWIGSISGVAEAIPANPPSRIEPFVESDRPFYEYRDLLSQHRADIFRTLCRDYRLNDPSKAENPDLFANPAEKRPANYTKYKVDPRGEWTGWCHTAPYLLPRDLYYAEHPEYFAMYDGTRIEPASYARMAICESNREGLKIAVGRAMALVELQKDRRFFNISPADTRLCACPDCLKANPLPDYATDRVIGWVNAFARPIRERYPDKVLMTLAYMETVKPPTQIRPEPNVSVMYCPWQWNSRGSSHVSFENPVNVTAMQEFAGWALFCPGQVAVYDYAYSDAVDGTAERIKLYARFGVRQAYYNGAKHERLLWLGSQLMWDPFQDIEPLNDEFVRLHYGPAAKPMGRLLAMEQEAVRRFVIHRKAAFEPQRHEEAPWWNDFCRETRGLVTAAEANSTSTDEATRIRILAGGCVAMQKVLALTHPSRGGPGLRAPAEMYKQDLAHAGRLAQQVLAACRKDAHRYLLARYQDELAKPLESLGVMMTSAADAAAAPAGLKFDPQLDQSDRLGDGTGGAALGNTPRRVGIGFDGADEAAQWLADATQADLIAPAKAARIVGADGKAVQGVRIDAPLSKLPVVPRGNVAIHAGRFYLERVLDQPLNAVGCHSISLHVHATRDVPVTFYTDAFRADVHLHPGEQIIRMDLRNFERFDAGKPLDIKSIALDIWPQDNFYPYPDAKDVSITVLGLTASNREPLPAELPYAGRTIWLSAFRATVPNEPPHDPVAVPREHLDKLRRTKQKGNIDRFLPRGKERFRTWCSHRTLTPMTAILTGGDPDVGATAQALQRYLERAFAVRLPVDPQGGAPGPDLGGVFLLGRRSAQVAGRITDRELEYAGPGGFALHATDGRVALAGADAQGTCAALERYLVDHGIRLFGSGTESVADLRADFLHELYTLDKPWFAECPAWDRWWLNEPAQGEALPLGDPAEALRLAASIKELARSGKHQVSADLLSQAGQTSLSRYVTSRLLRNPLDDATRAAREFIAASRDR